MHLSFWLERLLFEDFPPTNDEVCSSLTAPSDCDITQIILQVFCSAFSALISHLVEDHLPGGKLGYPI